MDLCTAVYSDPLNNNSAGTPTSLQTHSERHLAWEEDAGGRGERTEENGEE